MRPRCCLRMSTRITWRMTWRMSSFSRNDCRALHDFGRQVLLLSTLFCMHLRLRQMKRLHFQIAATYICSCLTRRELRMAAESLPNTKHEGVFYRHASVHHTHSLLVSIKVSHRDSHPLRDLMNYFLNCMPIPQRDYFEYFENVVAPSRTIVTSESPPVCCTRILHITVYDTECYVHYVQC